MGVGRDLAKGGGSAFLLNGAGKAFVFVSHLLLARWLGTEGYGMLSYALNLTALLALIPQAGLGLFVVRQVAIYVQEQQWEELKGLLFISNKIALSVSLLITLLAEAIVWCMSSRIDPTLLLTIQLSLLIVPVMVISQIRQHTLRGLRAIVFFRLPETIVMPLLLIVGLGLLWMAGLGLHSAVILQLLVAFIGLLVGSILLRKKLPVSLKNISRKYSTVSVIKSSLRLSIVSFSFLVLSKLDIFVLGFFATMDEVGVYAAVLKLGMMTSFGQSSIAAISAPLIAGTHQKNDKTKLKKIVRLASLWATMYAMLTLIIFSLFGKELLGLYGSAFSQGFAALLIVAFGELVSSFMGPVGQLLTMTGNERVFSRIMLCSALFGLCLYFIFTPIFGIVGVALSNALTKIVLNIWASIVVRKEVNCPTTFVY